MGDIQFDNAIKVLDGLQKDIDINLFSNNSENTFKDDYLENLTTEHNDKKDEKTQETEGRKEGKNNDGYSDVMKLLENSTKSTAANGIHNEAQKIEQYMGTRKKVFLDSIPKKPRWVWNRAPNLFRNDVSFSEEDLMKTGTPSEFVNTNSPTNVKSKNRTEKQKFQKSKSKRSTEENDESSNVDSPKLVRNENQDTKNLKSTTKKKAMVSPLYNISGMDTFLDRCDYANYQRVLKKENFYHIETGYNQNVPMILCESHNTHSYEEGFEKWNFSIDVENKKAIYKRNNTPSIKEELLETRMTNRSPGCVPKSVKKNPYKLYKDLAKQMAIEAILTEQQAK